MEIKDKNGNLMARVALVQQAEENQLPDLLLWVVLQAVLPQCQSPCASAYLQNGPKCAASEESDTHLLCQDTGREVCAVVPVCFAAGGYLLLSSSDADMLFKYFCLQICGG